MTNPYLPCYCQRGHNARLCAWRNWKWTDWFLERLASWKRGMLNFSFTGFENALILCAACHSKIRHEQWPRMAVAPGWSRLLYRLRKPRLQETQRKSNTRTKKAPEFVRLLSNTTTGKSRMASWSRQTVSTAMFFFVAFIHIAILPDALIEWG